MMIDQACILFSDPTPVDGGRRVQHEESLEVEEQATTGTIYSFLHVHTHIDIINLLISVYKF